MSKLFTSKSTNSPWFQGSGLLQGVTTTHGGITNWWKSTYSIVFSVHTNKATLIQFRVLTKKKGDKGYIWTFLGHGDSENAEFFAYRHSDGRERSTAAEVLGTSGGTLVLDAYSGYNPVTTPEGRHRAGCLARVHRKVV